MRTTIVFKTDCLYLRSIKLKVLMKNIALTLLLLGLLLNIRAIAQNDQNDKQSTGTLEIISIGIPVYVDQVGLELVRERNKNLSQANIGIADPESYILSPFDVVSFQFEGNFSFLVKSAVINAQGDVVIPQVGIVSLANMTIKEAHLKLQELAEKRFIKTKVSYLTLEHPRNVSVQIVGAVGNPTNFSLPGLTRLNTILEIFLNDKNEIKNKEREYSFVKNEKKDFTLVSDRNRILQTSLRLPIEPEYRFNPNEIFNGNWSLRDVKIKHRNGKVETIDFIRFLKTGDKRFNPILLHGDAIEIRTLNVRAPRVAISGAVNSPGEFTYKEGETLQDLIALGSGFTSIADTTFAIVYENNNQQKVVFKDWKTYKVKPNTHVIIPQVDNKIRASVSIEGKIKSPGIYPIVENETSLKTIIETAGGFLDDALLKGVYILRNGTERLDEIEKNNLDILLKRTSDQYAQGLKYLDIELALGQNKVYADGTNENALRDIILQDGDKIVVPIDRKLITVFGQVNKPGLYPYDEQVSIEEYIEKAGGISIAGVKDRIFVIKVGSRNWQKPEETKLESGDMIFVDRKPYEDFVTSQQLQINRTQRYISIMSLAVSTISTITVLIGVLTR